MSEPVRRSPFRDGAFDRHRTVVTARASAVRLDPPRWLALLWLTALTLAGVALKVVS
ncbi:MAG: hypothetical protein WCC60_20625 [Ilumatobacteraceae bacterium]